MLQKASETRYFRYQKEEAQNPYIGFCSFQHFRGEKIYSDRIVKPENNLCETEDVECYPVPEWVPQDGWSEGWYPEDTSGRCRKASICPVVETFCTKADFNL